MTEPPAGRPPWYSVGAGDVLTVVLALGIGMTASRGLLGDPGLGWHIRTPDLIVASGWPTADPFTGPSRGNPWLANQWLGDVPLWLGWRAAGTNGVVAVTILALVAAYRLLYGFLRADGLAWPAACLGAFAAASTSHFVWAARPNVVTFLGVLVLARVLTLFHEGRLSARRLAWLPLLFAVWANAHGGFVAGLAMLAVAAGVEFLIGLFHLDAIERSAARRRCGWLTLASAGAFLGTLANPYGWRLYPWVTRLLGDDYFMNLNQEWLSPDFHDRGNTPIALALVLFPALLAVSRHRPNIVLLALSTLWLFMALKGRRYVPMWVVVATPLAARAAAEIDWVNARLTRFWEARPDFREPLDFVRDGGRLGTAALLAGLVGWAAFAPPVVVMPSAVSVAGLDTLIAKWRPGEVVFHGPNEGGYLIWHGPNGFPMWIDDRNEVHGKEWYEAYFAVVGTAPGWEQTLNRWAVRWAAVPPQSPLAYRLAERPSEWAEVFRDDELAVFHRQP